MPIVHPLGLVFLCADVSVWCADFGHCEVGSIVTRACGHRGAPRAESVGHLAQVLDSGQRGQGGWERIDQPTWRFPEMGVPKISGIYNGKSMKILFKSMIFRCPYFRKPPYM